MVAFASAVFPVAILSLFINYSFQVGFGEAQCVDVPLAQCPGRNLACSCDTCNGCDPDGAACNCFNCGCFTKCPNQPPCNETEAESREYILAAENVCFSATSFVSDNNFTAPSNGVVSGIKLVHTSGGVTCNGGHALTNWGCCPGCASELYGVQMIRINDNLPGFTYYPTNATENITQFDATENCDECKVAWYHMNSQISVDDDQLILIDPDNPYLITTNDQFSLQYYEGCCSTSTSDNSGTSCADVYFLYESQKSREYIVFNESKNWTEAKAHCASLGTSLATIITNGDYANMKAAMDGAQLFTVWTGLNDIDSEGDYVWDDGTPCENDDGECINGDEDVNPQWGPSEPNDFSNEDCGELMMYDVGERADGRTIYYNDQDCGDDIPFICNAGKRPNKRKNSKVCTEEDIGSFNWKTLAEDGVDIPEFNVIEFNVSEDSLTLDIMVELEYLGSVMSDNDDEEASYGVTYVLDFEDYDAHENKINEPGSCQNRNASDFSASSLSFEDFWTYSDQPLWNNVGTNEYLAYPPPGEDWFIYMKDGDECSTIVYEGHFTWNDLVSCTSYDGSINYITTTDGDHEISLNGVFYINVVSPFVADEEIGYYRVYQLLSQAFTISIGKSVYVMGSTGINILSMSVIAVYKEDNANTFRLIVLTESFEYLMLTRDSTALYTYNPSSGGLIVTGDFTAPTQAVSVDEGCLNNKEFVCSQLWEIRAEDVDCRDGNDVGIDFSGDYTLQFVPQCRSTDDIGSDLNGYCDEWLSAHSDISDGVDLLASLTWKDEVCDPLLFEMQFEASMSFYIDENYENLAADDQLYQAGEDTIYIEIDTSFPSTTYSVFDIQLINVWICTFDPLSGPETPIDPNSASGGCFSSNRDGGNETDDNPYFYHIYSVDGPIEEEGFDLIGHPDDTEVNKDKLQFSFIVPSKIRRDTLYIHSQIEVSLSNDDESAVVSSRRLLAARERRPGGSANQMNHFLGNIGINRDHNPNPDGTGNNEYRYNYNPNPNQYPPQQIPFQSPPLGTTTTATISTSTWLIGIGSILGLIFCGNILFLCYINCVNKQQRARISFDHRRRNGYASVKGVDVDSSDVSDSEAQLIVDQEQVNHDQ